MKKYYVFLFALLICLCAVSVCAAQEDVYVPEPYQGILNLYQTAVDEKWDQEKLWNHDLNYMLGYAAQDNSFEVGWALVDLDEDGREELLIGAIAEDEFMHDFVLDCFYQIGENQAKRLFVSGERDRYYYLGGNRFAHEGSSSAFDSFSTTIAYFNGNLVDFNTPNFDRPHTDIPGLKKF